jgi:hypothetical protein
VPTGECIPFANLALVPLLADEVRMPDYPTLDEVLASQAARVTEMSEHDSVPELKFANESDRTVLLVDGEELIGANQNRVLNITVIVGGKRNVVIPVSCVECSRRSYRSHEFKSENFACSSLRSAVKEERRATFLLRADAESRKLRAVKVRRCDRVGVLTAVALAFAREYTALAFPEKIALEQP